MSFFAWGSACVLICLPIFFCCFFLLAWPEVERQRHSVAVHNCTLDYYDIHMETRSGQTCNSNTRRCTSYSKTTYLPILQVHCEGFRADNSTVPVFRSMTFEETWSLQETLEFVARVTAKSSDGGITIYYDTRDPEYAIFYTTGWTYRFGWGVSMAVIFGIAPGICVMGLLIGSMRLCVKGGSSIARKISRIDVSCYCCCGNSIEKDKHRKEAEETFTKQNAEEMAKKTAESKDKSASKSEKQAPVEQTEENSNATSLSSSSSSSSSSHSPELPVPDENEELKDAIVTIVDNVVDGNEITTSE